jgi:spermidine/putrescine transport system substrate-binding protein
MDSKSGVVRLRSFGRVSRRGFMQGAAALGGLAAAGLAPPRARAATSVKFVGFQEYDTALSEYMKAHDITMDSTYIGGSTEILAKLSAGGVGSIDIVTPYMGYVPLLVASDLLDPIDESLVPNLAHVHPVFKNNPNIRIDGKLYAAPFVWGGVPMMYDPAVIPTAPTSWYDVLKPEYKGKVGMTQSLNNILLASVIVNKTDTPSQITKEQLKAAVDFLIQVKANSRLVAASYGELADVMARGEVVITFNGWEVMKKMAADKGKKIEYTYPKEGTFGWLDNYCIVKNAPNRAVAHELANAALSLPVQLKAGNEDLLGIVNLEAIAKLDPAKRAIYPYDDIEGFGKRAGFYPIEPLKPDGKHATFEDWNKEYVRFKNA